MEELQPIYSNVKSFYKKARVLKSDDTIQLIRYSTKVAGIKNGKAHIFGWYSATTTRHIKEFLQQNGFKTGTKAQLEKMYC